MRRIPKLAFGFLALEIAALVFVSHAKPEYDGNDLGGLIFWLAYFHIFLIAAVVLFSIVIVQGMMRDS